MRSAVIPRLVWHYGEPFADPSAVPTYYVSEIARRKVTVALERGRGRRGVHGLWPLQVLSADFALRLDAGRAAQAVGVRHQQAAERGASPLRQSAGGIRRFDRQSRSACEPALRVHDLLTSWIIRSGRATRRRWASSWRDRRSTCWSRISTRRPAGHRRQLGGHPHLSARRSDGEGRRREHGPRSRIPFSTARPRVHGMGDDDSGKREDGGRRDKGAVQEGDGAVSPA